MSFTGTYSQYLRKVTLVVAGKIDGLDLSEFHIRFSTQQWSFQTPSNCHIRIFNVSDETAQKVQDEYTDVTLNAGYENGNEAQIFKGQLVQVRRGRESPVDTYLDLTAVADDAEQVWALVNTVSDRGSTYAQRVKLMADALGFKIGPGSIPATIPDGSLPRRKTMFGMAHQGMRDLAMATDTNWSVQNGQLIMVKQNDYLPGDAVELNSATGLIGFPEQTQQGLTVKCLLNPRLKCNGRIRINNKDITLQEIQLGYQASAQNYLIPQLDKSFKDRDLGLYRVLVLEHSGDTRGNEYYSNMICWALSQGGTLPQELVEKGYS